MRASLLWIALSLTLPCAGVRAQAEAQDEVLRLRSGRLVIGEIRNHDLDGVEVVSARDGARFRLVWADFFPGEAERLKRSLGYRVGTVAPEVVADRLLLKDGSVRLGRILRRDERGIELRNRNTTLVIPIQRLAAPPERISVPADQILTPEQFYAERAQSIDTEDAMAHYDFARELEAVFALQKAKEHMENARKLADASGDSALLRRVAGASEQLALRLENLEQAEVLEEVRQLMHRERFIEAAELLDGFEERFPGSPLAGEARDLQARFAEEREQAMARYVNRNWFNTAVALLKREALRREESIDGIMGWVESDLPIEIRTRLAEELQRFQPNVELSQVDALWQARYDHGAQRHQATFGDGSWVLGEDRARAGLDKSQEDPESGGRTEAEKQFRERVQRYLKNLNRARQQGSGDGEDPQDWWRGASPVERFQFLLAYYAEHGGDYQVTSPHFDRCPTCAGSGVIGFIDIGSQGSKERKERCPRCHGVGVRRAVTFR